LGLLLAPARTRGLARDLAPPGRTQPHGAREPALQSTETSESGCGGILCGWGRQVCRGTQGLIVCGGEVRRAVTLRAQQGRVLALDDFALPAARFALAPREVTGRSNR